MVRQLRKVGWPFHGLDQFETRHSLLTQIDSSNLDKLGMAWSASLDSKRGMKHPTGGWGANVRNVYLSRVLR